MDYPNNNTESRKNKHLNFKERMTIEIRLKDGFSVYKIAKELCRSINTITNEIKRGTTTQIRQGKYIKIYLADTGEAVYTKNRLNSCRAFKRLDCSEFIIILWIKLRMIHGHQMLALAKLSLTVDLSALKWFALKPCIMNVIMV